jgi:hypothetical protein
MAGFFDDLTECVMNIFGYQKLIVITKDQVIEKWESNEEQLERRFKKIEEERKIREKLNNLYIESIRRKRKEESRKRHMKAVRMSYEKGKYSL